MLFEKNRSGFVTTVRITSAADSLPQVLREIRLNDSVRAVLLCFDLEEYADLDQIDERTLADLRDLPVPVVAAVIGTAGRSVTQIVEAAHLSVAGASSGFVVAETGSATRKISADEALKMGLINRAVPPKEVEDEAFALAERISAMAPRAIRSCLKAVGCGLETTLEDGLKLESGLFAHLFATDDMREGTRAFLEKRAPHFSGK